MCDAYQAAKVPRTSDTRVGDTTLFQPRESYPPRGCPVGPCTRCVMSTCSACQCEYDGVLASPRSSCGSIAHTLRVCTRRRDTQVAKGRATDIRKPRVATGVSHRLSKAPQWFPAPTQNNNHIQTRVATGVSHWLSKAPQWCPASTQNAHVQFHVRKPLASESPRACDFAYL